MTHSIVHLSQLEGAHRLDAEYYQPEYFIDFRKGEWPALREVLGACQYGISQAMTEEPIGVPIFRMNDIKDGFLTDDNVKYVPIDAKTQTEYQLHEDDILFNRVNSEEFVGRTGIFKLTDRPYVFASYLIRIRPKEESGILPAYLNAFLNSSYGTRQIRKFARRAVNQANVNAQELRDIRIAMLPIEAQRKIETLVNNSFTSYQEARRLYAQAEQLLLRELGLDEPEQSDPISWVIQFSDVRTAARCDAEYFQSKYERIVQRIKEYRGGWGDLLSFADEVPADFDPEAKPDDAFNYVELSDINARIGMIESTSSMTGKDAPSRARRKLKTGDVIISTVEGSVEKVALVDEAHDAVLASTGFFQLRASHVSPEVLLVLAKSPLVQLQLLREVSGTILAAVPGEALHRMVIPKLQTKFQDRITELIRQSHASHHRAKQLFEEAKKKVEQIIERSPS